MVDSVTTSNSIIISIILRRRLSISWKRRRIWRRPKPAAAERPAASQIKAVIKETRRVGGGGGGGPLAACARLLRTLPFSPPISSLLKEPVWSRRNDDRPAGWRTIVCCLGQSPRAVIPTIWLFKNQPTKFAFPPSPLFHIFCIYMKYIYILTYW